MFISKRENPVTQTKKYNSIQLLYICFEKEHYNFVIYRNKNVRKIHKKISILPIIIIKHKKFIKK